MRFPSFRQLESIDCGPTCVRMISAYYGKKHSLQSIKKKCDFSRLGISIADVVNCCKQISLDAIALKGSISQLLSVQLPAILYWHQSHYVVLYRIEKKAKGTIYYIADPAFGKVKLSEFDFKEQWLSKDSTGAAIMIRPSESFYNVIVEENKMDYVLLKYLLQKYNKFKFKIVLSIILILASVAFSWIMPILFQKVIDNGVLHKNISIVWQLMFIQLAFFIGYIFSNNMSSIVLMKMNFSVSIEYLSDFLAKVIKLPIKYFDTHLNTDLIQRIEDQERLQSFLTFRVIDLFFAIINLVVFSSLLYYYNVTVFYAFFFASCLSLSWTFYFLRKRKYLDYSRFSAQSVNKNNLYELIMGMSEIKINNAQDTRISVWKKTQALINNISLKALYLNYYQLIGSSSINRIKDIAITTFCAFLIIDNQMTLGIMMSISYILGQLTGPLNQMSQLVQSFQDAKISLDRLSEIQNKKDENDENCLNVNALNKCIKISNISFKYEGSFTNYVLKNLSVTIPANKTTAIVGNSGSGKTTLLKLLLGFYYPQKGSIFIDDIEFNKVNTDSWRGRCGVVMQDGYIFSGTIAENIALGDNNLDFERVEYSAKIACADDFVNALPNKYQTKIGKSGLDLSGGQKQRILIARAVYKNPELIIFDEATSHLDTNNERKIMNNLQSFLNERTVIIVAHRLSTVINADNIVYLEQGRIIEQGTHLFLSQMKGHYYNLVKNQLELEK